MITCAIDRGGYILIYGATGNVQGSISGHKGLLGWTGQTVTVKCVFGANVYNEFGSVIATINCP